MKLDYDDYLQDIAFNYYGDKCALCNINNIKIYKKINKKNLFNQTIIFKILLMKLINLIIIILIIIILII